MSLFGQNQDARDGIVIGQQRAFRNPCAQALQMLAPPAGRHTHSESFGADALMNTHTHDHYQTRHVFNRDIVNVHMKERHHFSQVENFQHHGADYVCEDHDQNRGQDQLGRIAVIDSRRARLHSQDPNFLDIGVGPRGGHTVAAAPKRKRCTAAVAAPKRKRYTVAAKPAAIAAKPAAITTPITDPY